MTTTTSSLGPITLEPIFQERIWGVDDLPAWYIRPAAGGPIGEVWLTAETCIAADGPLPGQTLAELTKLYPEQLAGGASAQFSLLMKILLPREKLSVQVHPNDAEAQLLGQPRGKTECWYVLSADPGATVAVGFREPMTPDHIRAAIANNTLEAKLRYLPVHAGDMVFVDAGTVHAIGPGMVVLETQQYSDITYRLYDYGRPRELHVDAGLAVSKNSLAAGLIAPVPMEGFTRLVASDYFLVDRFELGDRSVLSTAAPPPQSVISTEGAHLRPSGETRSSAPLLLADKLQILVALTDGCTVTSATATAALPPGRVVLLPAEDIAYALEGAGEVIRIVQP
jgi:mannose-6-phosphate isomerase